MYENYYNTIDKCDNVILLMIMIWLWLGWLYFNDYFCKTVLCEFANSSNSACV